MRRASQSVGARRKFQPAAERIENRILLHARLGTDPLGAAALANALAHTLPVIIQATEVINTGEVDALQSTFSKPVNPAGLNDVSHYVIENLSPNGIPNAAITAATYNRAQNSLTVTLTNPVPPGPFILTSPGYALHPSTAFIADAQGRALKTPGGDFTVMFESKGPNTLNAVLTPYPAINRLDGAYHFYDGSVSASRVD